MINKIIAELKKIPGVMELIERFKNEEVNCYLVCSSFDKYEYNYIKDEKIFLNPKHAVLFKIEKEKEYNKLKKDFSKFRLDVDNMSHKEINALSKETFDEYLEWEREKDRVENFNLCFIKKEKLKI